MDPFQFEQAVANHFQQQGYIVKLTRQSYDYGVDVIASNENERIAVQVKMYEQRQVNYQDVMYLFAGKSLYECNSAVLITNGQVSAAAERVAEKLGVKVAVRWLPSDALATKQFVPEATSGAVEVDDYRKIFYKAWKQHVLPLKGTKVYTKAMGRENSILDVTWDCLERESSNGKTSKINIDIFRYCHAYILENGQMTRAEINHHYTKRGSAIIFAILEYIPYFRVEYRQEATLVLENDKFQEVKLFG